MTDLHSENVRLPLDQTEDRQCVPQASPRRGGTGPSLSEPADHSKAVAGGTAPTPGRVVPVLRVLGSDNRPEYHLLAVGKNTVGRLPDNDVVVASPYVSRRHCVIRVLPDGSCIVQDLGSTAGVYVEGERIKHLKLLRVGDEIRVGGLQLVLLYSVNGTANTDAAE